MENLVLESLIKLYERDINKLEQEIALFQQESLLWKTGGDIKNSAGNLCLHLCGNLQHYIGKGLGGFNYVRNRENEFAARNISQDKLLTEIRTTKDRVLTTLRKLDAATLQQEYAEAVFDYKMTTLYFLIHLHGHLNYHLGQINYHRRLVGNTQQT